MFLVMTIEDNIPKDIVLLTENREEAESCFLGLCEEVIEELNGEMRECLLDEGYCDLGEEGSIVYLDLSNAKK
jgi:hypothetical protein